MKKLISSVLVLVILLSFAIPAMAANDLQTMRASLLLDGGLKYEESTGRYILYGRATGIVENKTVTANVLLGWGINSSIQGVLSCGIAVLGNQLYKQAQLGVHESGFQKKK